MRATAERIGKSQKERILIDGEVFLKSVSVGRWSYIVVIKTANNESIGKSATKENAEKWQPHEMVSDSYRQYREEFEAAVKRGAKVIRKNGCVFAREPIPYTREIFAIERV